MADGLDPSPQLDEIERLAARRRAKFLLVGRGRLEAMARTESAQGVLALAAPLEEVELEVMCRGSEVAPPFLLVLDGISDPQNLGALMRSAECAGVTGIVLPRHRAVHVTPTVAKVAAGAVERVPIALVPGIPNALQRLEASGLYRLGLDAKAPTSLFELGSELAGPLAVVLGAESKGLSALSRRRCDLVVSIPQHGALGSLNVAAAGAVACFEIARCRSVRANT